MRQSTRVTVRLATVTLPTYLPAPPDRNPMFLEKRVYQGSSGQVYPLPFTDRIGERPVDRKWKAIWIENEFLRALVLPEIGGRIHRILDKTNAYDLVYHQPVIKPALVGLAGPWISGGIEFNWPQHHRPATFLPVDFEVEEHADGSKTIWCGDHDPLARMKGMHGVCLHPGRAYLELKVRAYNRTPFVQTFLWWANAATRVHEAYQSFFPPDVQYVADHARRSMSGYPRCDGSYYGVDYGERGRKGIPANEVPRQFVPPHVANSKSRVEDSKLPEYAPNDLSFYANIPVPTSYMCMGSREDFFGGYDYKAQAGVIHIANHHISPGKKQWTWGNHEFGYAWDRNLTDADERGEFTPYIEIMAGVYTDNQPDFSFLQPGETRTWSQYWYPIQKIGPAQHANLKAAVSLRRGGDRSNAAIQIGVSVTRAHRRAVITLEQIAPGEGRGGGMTSTTTPKRLARFTRDLAPGKPFTTETELPRGVAESDLRLRVTDREGHEIISHQPKPLVKGKVPPPATEPPAPTDIASADELFVTGLHLGQYRHATRCPTLYWREALRRDPLDARCNNALGLWHLKRGEFTHAEKHFRTAIERLTRRNANPADGEPYYNLALCLRSQAEALPNLLSHAWGEGRGERARLHDEAYAALYKATWNQAWAGAAYHALAEMDCVRHDWSAALDHLDRSLCFDTNNLRARNLKVMVLRKLNQSSEASSLLKATSRLDRLDWWARHLLGEPLTCDLQVALDLAHDLARAGFHTEAIAVLAASATRLESKHKPKRGVSHGGTARIGSVALPTPSWGALPLVHYTLGWLEQRRAEAWAVARLNAQTATEIRGGVNAALRHFRAAAGVSPDYCFPSRLEEIAILQAAMRANPRDARAPYYLGNLFYDRRRHAEAIELWERSAKLDPKFATVWRNLGIGYFNIRRQPVKARAAYDRAFQASPDDARVFFERDQLWKRLREQPKHRLRELERHPHLVQQRDDLSVELGALYNQTGQPEKALALVSSRKFQPWEGGEGGPLGQWVRAHLALGRAALMRGDFVEARSHFEQALTAPLNLGEARHLLANESDVHYWMGNACAAGGDAESAHHHWSTAANFKGDFQEMSVRAFSEMTYFSALAMGKLGRRAEARKLFRELLAYGLRLQKATAKIDYFATSLPTMLLFEDDLQLRQETTALFLQAQACLGLGRKAQARRLFRLVLKRDPSHALATDLLVL